MSDKVKITADAALAIVRGILTDEEVNTVLTDPSAPERWRGKSIDEIINAEYYTFKHRPLSSADVVKGIIEEEKAANRLEAVNRAFCLFSLGNTERLYSKDVDMSTMTAALEYFLQTEKIKLLEYMFEDANIATSGIRIPVQIGDKTRKAVVIFGRPDVKDIQTGTPFGEMAHVEIEVSITLYPDVVSYSDYTVSMRFTNETNTTVTCAIPLSCFSFLDTMTQEAAPKINNHRKVGNVNLSCANTFVLVFEGYNNPFINYITDRVLSAEAESGGGRDNNQLFTLIIKRGNKMYTHSVVVKDHQTTVNADTSNETHTLTLTTRGLI